MIPLIRPSIDEQLHDFERETIRYLMATVEALTAENERLRAHLEPLRHDMQIADERITQLEDDNKRLNEWWAKRYQEAKGDE